VSQRPPLQTCARGQTRPHVPQFSGSVRRFRHSPAQSAKSLGQSRRQAPSAQICCSPQTNPQRPQFRGSLWMSAQPLAHATRRPGQRQRPSMQPVPLCPRAHETLQLPQCAVSVSGSTHAPSQRMRPSLQADAHMPELQNWPCEQTLPQKPQLAGSEAMLVQVLKQSVEPGQGSLHRPSKHVASGSQGEKQSPQWNGSRSKSTQESPQRASVPPQKPLVPANPPVTPVPLVPPNPPVVVVPPGLEPPLVRPPVTVPPSPAASPLASKLRKSLRPHPASATKIENAVTKRIRNERKVAKR
jgi:hypothetical protein